MKEIGVIGSGFSSLSAACFLAKAGFNVTVFEKNEEVGGRARMFKVDGFTFDMGPSWYWMPEVFENFFNSFGKSTSDYYDLVRLNPSYKVIFGKNDEVDIPANYTELKSLFESIESGSAAKLDKFMKDAEYKYKVGMEEFVWKPGISITEFADSRILTNLFKMDIFTSISRQIRSLFKNEKLRKILEFPVLFLGATPEETPALYSLMNYADFKLGTWYPLGGMHKIIEGMHKLALELGVEFLTSNVVTKITTKNNVVNTIETNKGSYNFDVVVSGADYHHTETNLLDKKDQSYSDKYWANRVMAPSSLLFFIGLDRKIPNLEHHNLFFDKDFKLHAKEIYLDPKWPTDPLFYVCCPSKTDVTVAPVEGENIFVLIPIAPDLEDTPEMREIYFEQVCNRLKDLKGIDLKSGVLFKRSYCLEDFKSDYNSFKGNAYGLANTLFQTAFLKPKIKSKKVGNLYYTGQLTSPGPGMPPSIISGEVVANLIISKRNSI